MAIYTDVDRKIVEMLDARIEQLTVARDAIAGSAIPKNSTLPLVKSAVKPRKRKYAHHPKGEAQRLILSELQHSPNLKAVELLKRLSSKHGHKTQMGNLWAVLKKMVDAGSIVKKGKSYSVKPVPMSTPVAIGAQPNVSGYWPHN